ncbi:MAG: 16S rRNA processing protein RimM [Clostridiales bacterium]|nr:16S rRNA processing protein RimM [Clostridiales bacterium]
MEEFLRIGVIVKPQGIKGEVKVIPLTDDPNRFKKLKEVYIDGEKRKVLSAKVGVDSIILAISGIADRNEAEIFRGKYLSVDRQNAVELEKGRYFIVDILGCTIFTDNGLAVGEVIDVTSARTDIFTVKCIDGRVMRFPFLKDLIVSVDVANKKIILKETRLKEVSCYED